jgi:hypothetical protein
MWKAFGLWAYYSVVNGRSRLANYAALGVAEGNTHPGEEVVVCPVVGQPGLHWTLAGHKRSDVAVVDRILGETD